MFCVGLTGNIASGKSTAMHCFHNLGVPVIIADNIAREITSPGQPAVGLIKHHFGNSIVTSLGELNRAALREIIFADPEERQWLEDLLHPLIRRRIEQHILLLQGPYCVIEIPLLLRRQDYPYLNRVLAIIADDELLISRVMQRDDSSREQALAILASQPDNEARRALADDVIVNNGSIDDLEKEIVRLHEHYLTYSAQL